MTTTVDGLSALGQAASIVQFLDFVCERLTSTRALCRRGSGAGLYLNTTVEHKPVLYIDDIANDSESIRSKLGRSATEGGDLGLLAAEGESILQCFLKLVFKLRGRTDIADWPCLAVALRDVAKNEEHVGDLCDRLCNLHCQITFHISRMLK
jgi:hypothetical protein